jgi:hypothetical protein
MLSLMLLLRYFQLSLDCAVAPSERSIEKELMYSEVPHPKEGKYCDH